MVVLNPSPGPDPNPGPSPGPGPVPGACRGACREPTPGPWSLAAAAAAIAPLSALSGPGASPCRSAEARLDLRLLSEDGLTVPPPLPPLPKLVVVCC